MKIEVLHESATPFKLHLAEQAVERALQAAAVTPDECYAAEAAMLDWEDGEHEEPFKPTPAQKRALDALSLAEQSANEALGVKHGEPGAMLDWVES